MQQRRQRSPERPAFTRIALWFASFVLSGSAALALSDVANDIAEAQLAGWRALNQSAVANADGVTRDWVLVHASDLAAMRPYMSEGERGQLDLALLAQINTDPEDDAYALGAIEGLMERELDSSTASEHWGDISAMFMAASLGSISFYSARKLYDYLR